MKLTGFFCFIITLSFSVNAEYPGIDSNYICNGYDTVEGVVTRVVATTTYNKYEAVFVRIKGTDGNAYGGRIYPRDPVAYGYVPMVNLANISLVTKTPVKLCVSSSDSTDKGDDIYAIELLGDK